MSEILVANRYAKALFRIHNGDIPKAKKLAEVLSVVNQLFADKKVRKVLVSPAMPADLKRDILYYAVEKAAGSEEMKRFIDAIINSGRVAVLPEISSSFHQLINKKEGVVEATISSVTPLSDEDLKNLGSYLQKIENKKVQITQKIDKSILGGFVIRVGNSLLDLSLRTKLESIAKNAAR